MKTLIMDFNDSLAEYLGIAPGFGIATRERTFDADGSIYHASVINQEGRFLLALRDDQGAPCPDFEVRLEGVRRVPDAGEEAVALSLAEVSGLSPVILSVGGRAVCRVHVIPQEEVQLDAEDARAQSEAWNFLYRSRTCPPASVLAENDDRARRHRAFCPSCRDIAPSADQAALLRELRAELPLPGHERPVPGQVWSLRRELAGWNEEDEYLRPQLVVLVSAGATVRAVPCCPAGQLAVDSDIELERGLGFAEYWNAMDLPAQALGSCFGALGPALVRELEARAEQPPALGSVWRRRMLELEERVAKTMTERALLLALAPERDAADRPLTETLTAAFANMAETLRQWVFPPQPVVAPAMGAARTYVLRPLEGTWSERPLEITSWIADDEGLHVSGRLDLPKNVCVLTVLAILDVDGGVIEAASAEAHGPYFAVTFPSCPEAGRDALRLAAVTAGA